MRVRTEGQVDVRAHSTNVSWLLKRAAVTAAAAVLLGACATGGSSSSPPSSADSGTSITTDSGGSGGPCNGNPCIGDWQKEAAEGGTVVQCNDGTWSHAGGLQGACSDHGGESTGQRTSGQVSTSSLSDTGGSGGPCNGNPCIGDWQKEVAEGGTVVQCNDGTWSHAGGLQGACSDHGGESGGQASNTSSTSPPSAGSSGYGVQDLPVQCGYGVAGSSEMTCDFAENAFYEYWKASGGNPTQSENINVWSALSHQRYPLSCGAGNGMVDCTGTNSSSVPLDARFTQSAVSAYTSAEAGAYAASGKLGPPTSTTSSPSAFTPGDQNPDDPNASVCESTMEIGPHSGCSTAQQVAADLGQGIWSAPGSDTVSDGGTMITFNCAVVGQDYSQASQPAIYSCVSESDPQDWFEFEFT